MAEFLNATTTFVADNWTDCLSQAPEFNTRHVLLALVNIPLIAIVINVLKQLVRRVYFSLFIVL